MEGSREEAREQDSGGERKRAAEMEAPIGKQYAGKLWKWNIEIGKK